LAFCHLLIRPAALGTLYSVLLSFGAMGIFMLRFALCCVPLLAVLATAAFADDALDVKKAVRAHLDAYEKSDPQAYTAHWASDGKLTRGREEAAGKYDIAMDRKQIDEYWLLAQVEPSEDDQPTKYADVSVKADGKQAELRIKTTTTEGDVVETIGNLYRLRKEASGWKIYAHRSWPLELKTPDGVVVHNAQSYKELDAAADLALRACRDAATVKAGGEPLRRARVAALQALITAYRSAEAHALTKELTMGNASASHWKIRGNIALFAADPADAKVAFEKALQLDPKVDVPKAIREKAKK
jgi:hypothetical protein